MAIRVSSFSPTGSDVVLNPIIKIVMTNHVDTTSLSKYNCLVFDIFGNKVERIISYDSNTKTIKIYPVGKLTVNTGYTIRIKGLDGASTLGSPLAIKDLTGNYLQNSVSFNFTTGEGLEQSYPVVSEAVETCFSHIEGYEQVRALVVEETGEPTVYLETAAGLNYSGELVEHDDGSAIFLNGVFQAEVLPEKTSTALAITDYYPKLFDFSYEDNCFILYFNDTLEAWVRNTYGIGIYGLAYYEEFVTTIKHYIRLWNYVPYSTIMSIDGTYSPVEYDVEYIPSIFAVRLTVTNATGWNAETGAAEAGILDWNSIYVLECRAGLEGLVTQPLQESLEVVYSTQFYPSYCDLLTVRQLSGYVRPEDYDDTYISTLLFRASLEADAIIAEYETTLTQMVINARRRYVCCLVRLWLLMNVSSSSGDFLGLSEKLGDYSHRGGYSNTALKPFMDELLDCVALNEAILKNGQRHPAPRHAQRAKNNIRRPQKYRWTWDGYTNGDF